jgi:hypothetical protein
VRIGQRRGLLPQPRGFQGSRAVREILLLDRQTPSQVIQLKHRLVHCHAAADSVSAHLRCHGDLYSAGQEAVRGLPPWLSAAPLAAPPSAPAERPRVWLVEPAPAGIDPTASPSRCASPRPSPVTRDQPTRTPSGGAWFHRHLHGVVRIRARSRRGRLRRCAIELGGARNRGGARRRLRPQRDNGPRRVTGTFQLPLAG